MKTKIKSKKTKYKTWQRQKSKMGLLLSLTTLMATIVMLLSPSVGAGGATTQLNAVLTATTSCTFTASNTAINFGTLPVGTNTIGTNSLGYNTISVSNAGGSTTSNIYLSGSNWNYNANTFTVTNTIYSLNGAGTTGGNTVFGPAGTISAAATTSNVEFYLTGTTTDILTPVTTSTPKTVWFGANVPGGVLSGSYAQTINIISSC